ncbi:unnamed protein product, partial [Ectocarpus sp. 12 AP-2014]
VYICTSPRSLGFLRNSTAVAVSGFIHYKQKTVHYAECCAEISHADTLLGTTPILPYEKFQARGPRSFGPPTSYNRSCTPTNQPQSPTYPLQRAAHPAHRQHHHELPQPDLVVPT